MKPELVAVPEVPEPARPQLLTVEEVAGILRVSGKWVYRHAARLPFTRRLSPGTLRFDEAGLLRWIERRKA